MKSLISPNNDICVIYSIYDQLARGRDLWWAITRKRLELGSSNLDPPDLIWCFRSFSTSYWSLKDLYKAIYHLWKYGQMNFQALNLKFNFDHFLHLRILGTFFWCFLTTSTTLFKWKSFVFQYADFWPFLCRIWVYYSYNSALIT